MDEKTSDSFGTWLAGLQAEKDDAVQRLWEQYFQRLTSVARAKLPEVRKRVFDEEDVALSALQSFCDGIRAGRFLGLDDEGNLWALLVMITKRKAAHRIRDETAKKRGGGNLQGESALEPGGIRGVIAGEPNEEFAMQMVAELDHLRATLQDEGLQQIALYRLQGLTNAEIAEKMGCVERTIDRRLALIRRIWVDAVENDERSAKISRKTEF